MNDPLGKHHSAFSDLATVSEQVRRMVEPTKAVRDALDAIAGSPTMRLMQDIMAKDSVRNAFSPPNAAMEIMRTMKLTDDMNRRMLGLHDLPLKTVFDQLSATPNWLDKAIGLTNQKWLKGFAELGGMSHTQQVLDDTTKRLALTAARFDQHTATLRAISDALKPTLDAQRSITAMFERLGLDSATRLKELYEPTYSHAIRDTLARIQIEQTAFAKALPNLSSPWSGIDWARMNRLMDQAATLVDDAEATDDVAGEWDVDSIPPEEQAEYAEAMRPVASAIELAAASPEDRANSQAQAIARIMELQETLLTKYARQEEHIAKLAKPPVPLWVRSLIKVLEWVVVGLLIEWAGPHVSPEIDRVLGLLSKPVSIQSQSSVIRRDAADAVQAIEGGVQDARLLRVVVRRSLPVYAWPDSRDSPFHRVRSGQIVAIVEWRKKWRLISWRDAESGELLSGWVRAKYIAKIRR